MFRLHKLAWIAGFIVGVSFLIAQPSDAKKGGNSGGGGGDGPSTLTGTVYYSGQSFVDFVSMNPDGTNKTHLPSIVDGDPSYRLHSNRRWFLQLRYAHEYGPFEFYPDGSWRHECFAIRDDGDESHTVQLTDDPTLQFLESTAGVRLLLRWTPAEDDDVAIVAGLAQRWVWNGNDWVVDPDSVGLYATQVLFDDNGNVSGTDGDPILLFPLPGGAAGYHFDWSPDMSKILYATADQTQIRLIDTATGVVSTLVAQTDDEAFYLPSWSPPGDLIAFGDGWGNIETIKPDGSGRARIIKRTVNYGVYWPRWSPTGSHLICIFSPWGDSSKWEVYRYDSRGRGKTNLTGDVDGPNYPVAWR